MKNLKPALVIFLLLISNQLCAQESDFEIQNIEAPFAPGERLLNFKVDDLLQAQYYVFYSNNRADLSSINLNDNNTLPQGKVIKYEGNTSRESRCEFVFPGRSTPHAPNIRYYLELSNARRAGLKGSDYLTRSDRGKIPQLYISTDEQFDTDKNERVFRKECMFFRVMQLETLNGGKQLSSIHEFYMPDDFTIGFVGDSYAAGTGADINPTNPCYRSDKSGQMRAVKKFITNYPDVSVSYTHAACSGATTTHLNTYIQQNEDGNINQNTQFNMIDEWLDTNNHDYLGMLIMNIGGNDIDFADLVKGYYVFPGNFVGSEDQESMQDRFEILNERYDYLAADIDNRFPSAVTSITTLPNIARNKENEICCDSRFNRSEYSCAYNFSPFSIIGNPPGEFLAIQNDVVLPLNRTIRNKANEHGWGVIDVESNAKRNGLCVCDDDGGYFWKFTNAVGNSDVLFTAHPNANGYDNIYKQDISNHIADKYFEYLTPYYPLRLLRDDIEIPDCKPFIFSYLQELKLTNPLDISGIKSNVKRNQIKDNKNKLLTEVEKAIDPRVPILNEQKRQVALITKKNKLALQKIKRKPKKTQIISKKTGKHINIKKRLSTIESTIEYKNWVNAKTLEEKKMLYQLIDQKMNKVTEVKKQVPIKIYPNKKPLLKKPNKSIKLKN